MEVDVKDMLSFTSLLFSHAPLKGSGSLGMPGNEANGDSLILQCALRLCCYSIYIAL